MKAVTFSTHFLISIILGCLLFSCTSKIPYGSTYYFPLEPVAKSEKAVKSDKMDQESEDMLASIEKISSIAPSVEGLLEKSHENMARISKISRPEEVAGLVADKKAAQNLSKKEAKYERKEARKALKQAVKEYKHDIKEQKKESAQKALTKNMKIGIILAAIGVLLLILPLGYAGYILGTIGLVVGLVLILIEAL